VQSFYVNAATTALPSVLVRFLFGASPAAFNVFIESSSLNHCL